jgi:hypothetical protein
MLNIKTYKTFLTRVPIDIKRSFSSGSVHFHYVFTAFSFLLVPLPLYFVPFPFFYLFHFHFVVLPVSLSFCSAHVPFSFQGFYFRSSLSYSFRLCPFWFHSVPMTFYYRPIYFLFRSILFRFVHFRFHPVSLSFLFVSFVFNSFLGFCLCSMHVPIFFRSLSMVWDCITLWLLYVDVTMLEYNVYAHLINIAEHICCSTPLEIIAHYLFHLH